MNIVAIVTKDQTACGYIRIVGACALIIHLLLCLFTLPSVNEHVTSGELITALCTYMYYYIVTDILMELTQVKQLI